MGVGRWRRGTALLVMSAGVLALDVVTGPYIQFPITFVAPVGLAAWYLGRQAALGYAVGLVACRFAIAVGVESEMRPLWSVFVNAGIRLAVLGGLAVLLDQVAWQKRKLTDRLQMLEGILPICAFCKKIRRADGTWEQIESYVSHHSKAQFSHGCCEACAREEYPEFLAGSADPEPDPGQRR